jgi:hypothetical protein
MPAVRLCDRTSYSQTHAHSTGLVSIGYIDEMRWANAGTISGKTREEHNNPSHSRTQCRLLSEY